jgi:ABC-type sulfate transport system permease subunit
LTATAALWLTVVAVGLYHGLNPAMGWPLAVANGMTQQRGRAVLATLLPLGGGHFAAMAVVLIPFAWLSWYVEWSRAIRLGAGALVLLFGLYKLVQRRHPRALARVRPTQLAWWSFLMATAHGAGLMLVPVMLGLCASAPSALDAATAADAGHATVMNYLAQSNVATAVLVAAVHTLAMMLAGLSMAWAVYRYLGLPFLRRFWLDLDRVWGWSLVIAGAAGVAMAL